MNDLIGRRVVLVGAGISGLRCAQRLQTAGCAVQLLDKSGDIGGRLAARIRPEGSWNHGPQQLAISTPEFADFAAGVASADGAAMSADEAVVAGLPNMRELVRPMADGLDCRFDCTVTGLARGRGGWRLLDHQGGMHGDYAALVLALPAPQALRLLSGASETLQVPPLRRQLAPLIQALAEVEYSSCWTLLVRCSDLQDVPRLLGNEIIATIYPQADPRCWVVHATPAWSARHSALDKPSAAQSLLMALKALCSANPGFKVDHVEAHLWRYSTVRVAAAVPALWSSELGLGLCGDWCQPQPVREDSTSANGAETAFQSGAELASMMLARASNRPSPQGEVTAKFSPVARK